MQAWALAQGLDVNVQKMSQMEKTMLRYQYVMANTAAATNDFQRTSGSWANQLRILNQQFQQLGGIVGGVLINAFKPFISALNSVMQSVITFAKTVANALGAIFGWTIEINSGGLANDFEAAGDGADEMESGTGGAAKNLKDMNKYIAAWHEVNNMTTDDDAGGGGGGGGGGGAAGDLGDAAEAQFKRTESLLDKFRSEIDNLYDLGKYIGESLTNALNSIDWDKIYQTARNFGTGLAQFLNGLISPELFGALGRTIANSLNTALHFLNAFGYEFDWTNFGNSLAAGVNEFFLNFDFKLFADTINVWLKGILDTIITFIDKTDWGMIGTKIGEFLVNIDFLEIGSKIGKAIWKAINAGFEMFEGMFETVPLETALLSLAAITKLLKSDYIKNFASAIGGSISNVVNFGKALAGNKAALEALQVSFPKTSKAVEVLSKAFQNFRFGIENGNFLTGVNEGLSTIRNNLTGMQKLVITATASFAEFAIVKDSVKDIATGAGSLVTNLAELVGSAGLAGAALYTALGPGGLAIGAVTGIIAAIQGINDATLEVAQNSAIGQFAQTISDLSDDVSRKTEEISKNLESTKSRIEDTGVAEAQMARDLARQYEDLASKSSLTAKEQTKMKDVSERLVELVPGLSGYINEQTGYLDIQNQTLEDLITNMELYAKKQASEEMLVEAYKLQYQAQKNVADAEKERNQAISDLSKDIGISSDMMKQLADGTLSVADATEQVYNAQQELTTEEMLSRYGVKDASEFKAAATLAVDAVGSLNNSLSEAKRVEADAGENLKFVTNIMEENTAAITKNEEEMRKEIQASDEYQQKLVDVESYFKKLNMTVSDALKENLAFEDSGVIESIAQTFEKMKNQTEISMSELQQFFAAIAPGISSSFIEEFSKQGSDMQASVAMTLADMAAGAEVSAEKLKEVFNVIGYDIPKEALDGFKESSPQMQIEAVNFMTQIENGMKLTGPNLLKIFDAFGYELPREVISAIAEMEAPAQQETIEFFGQIAAGYEGTKDDLLTKFEELGFDLPQSLIDSIESMNDETFDQVVQLLGQILIATDEERGPLIEELKQFGIDLDVDGVSAGMEEGKDTVETTAKSIPELAANSMTLSQAVLNVAKTAGKDLINGFISGMEDGEARLQTSAAAMGSLAVKAIKSKKGTDEHSPSKKTREVGAYFVEGFNEGIEDEANTTYRLINDYAKGIINGFDFQIPALDMSVPTLDLEPKSFDLGSLKSTMQMEIDTKMASLDFQNQQLQSSIEENTSVLQEILARGIVLDDNNFTKRYERSAKAYRRRTGAQLGVAF